MSRRNKNDFERIADTSDAASDAERALHFRGRKLAARYGFTYDPTDPPPIDLFQTREWIERNAERAFMAKFDPTIDPDTITDPGTYLDWMIATKQDFPDGDDVETWEGDKLANFKRFMRIVETTVDSVAKAERDEADAAFTHQLQADMQNVAISAKAGGISKQGMLGHVNPNTYLRIVAAFEANPRASTKEIADELGLSSTSVNNAKKHHVLKCIQDGTPIPFWCRSTRTTAFAKSILTHLSAKIDKQMKGDSDE